MKKISVVLMSIFLFLTLGNSTTFANTTIKVNVDNKILNFDTEPFIENGTTLVPMRKIFESLNADVKWVDETKQIIATDDNNSIVLTIGSTIAQKNGTSFNLSIAPKIVKGSTFVPVRFIAESLNSDVTWDNASRTVIINSKKDAESESIAFNDYVPYNTSNLVTLARNLINGDVVYFDGQYWATPEFASMIANENIVYENDISAGVNVENNDKHNLIDLSAEERFELTEWIAKNSVFLDGITFDYFVKSNENRELVRAGYFYNTVSKEVVYTLWDMTTDFAESDNAEAEFNGIRVKKIEGDFYFFKEDLIKNGLIKK